MSRSSAQLEVAAPPGPPFVAPRELAVRWRCARSSVDRIARRAGLTRVCLGSGRKGMIRYILAEVERFEVRRMVKAAEVPPR
jgi:hypothetical protein